MDSQEMKINVCQQHATLYLEFNLTRGTKTGALIVRQTNIFDGLRWLDTYPQYGYPGRLPYCGVSWQTPKLEQKGAKIGQSQLLEHASC